MSFSRSAYYSRAFRDFQAIDAANHRERIAFFEQYENHIRGLDFEEFFELLYCYTQALFESGSYVKHILLCEECLYTVIENNIHSFNGQDLYHALLFTKAAAQYNIKQTDAALHTLQELIKLDPSHQDAVQFYEKILFEQPSSLFNFAKAAAIALYFAAAFIILIELLVVRNFYTIYVPLVEATRNSLVVAGILGLVAGYGYRKWIAIQQRQSFIASARDRRRKKDLSDNTVR